MGSAGVEPHQLLDLFALVGDRADGISGCKGIGLAAARKVLNAFDGLEVMPVEVCTLWSRCADLR